MKNPPKIMHSLINSIEARTPDPLLRLMSDTREKAGTAVLGPRQSNARLSARLTSQS